MEEAWELAVVSEAEVFLEGGLEFIRLNEFAIRFHLVSLDGNVRDFMNAYNYLHTLSQGSESDLPTDQEVWDAVIVCAESIAGIANILIPNPRRQKDNYLNKFTQFRAEVICGLLLLNVDERRELVNFRNRIHHEDEDFDEWYYGQMSQTGPKPKKIIRRKILWGVSPINLAGEVFASAYDAKTGGVHFFEHHIKLHDLMTLVTTINKRFESAFLKLTELSGKASTVATL